MQRAAHARRSRLLSLRLVGTALALSFSLATCSVLLTACIWRQTRELQRSFNSFTQHLAQVDGWAEATVGGTGVAALAWGTANERVKREAPRGRARGASHFEIKESVVKQVQGDGVVRGWVEEELNVSKAARYNSESGSFTVEKAGVYFLYCQVHFNEKESPYVKLEVLASGHKVLQCIEGYGTTPSSATGPVLFIKPCHVSGLLRLNKGTELKIASGPNFNLQGNGKHYFGLFRIM